MKGSNAIRECNGKQQVIGTAIIKAVQAFWRGAERALFETRRTTQSGNRPNPQPCEMKTTISLNNNIYLEMMWPKVRAGSIITLAMV